jgi:hypothetical protein
MPRAPNGMTREVTGNSREIGFRIVQVATPVQIVQAVQSPGSGPGSVQIVYRNQKTVVGDEKKIVDQENYYAACWPAIENLLVAANARGLGSYPSTGDWIDQNFVGPVLGLTEKERPVACIFLGYSEQKTMAKRLPWSAIPPGTLRPEILA